MLDLQDQVGDDMHASLAARHFSWLVRLRWFAICGTVFASFLAALGIFPGVNWRVIAVSAAVAAIYNAVLSLAHRNGRAETGPRAALAQALGDFSLLTVVLWASGGVESPFVAYYAFHVALAGIIAGPRATFLACAAAFACGGFLLLGEIYPIFKISEWAVEGSLRPLSDVGAFASTVAGIAYIVTHAAAELRDREEALAQARDRARLEYEVLSTTLHELDAGLEIVDAEGDVVFKNRLAKNIVPTPEAGARWHCPGGVRPCERDVSDLCPLHRSLDLGESGHCRFAIAGESGERIYELHSFPLASSRDDNPTVMNLYVDRTNAMLAERQLMLAERLSSLGRIAQGVAHELNTPLATIRTLAADMGVALSEVPAANEEKRGALVVDIGESAKLIHEETGRLGRITHALLAGGDLVRARIDGSVTFSAALERGCALVLAGSRRATRIEIDPSVERVSVVADPDRLVQVIVNLVQNASDAMRERGVGVLRIWAQKELSGFVAIHFADDGPGIAENIRQRLFEPFATTKPQGEGTGLGLYTSYMLVQAMRGTLALENRKEGGACAILRLPIGRREQAQDSHAQGVRA
jgi:signal transduction histidine kinase